MLRRVGCQRLLSTTVAPVNPGGLYETHYEFRSIKYSTRLRVKCLHADNETLPSLTPLFAGANWLEVRRWACACRATIGSCLRAAARHAQREIYDLFGIFFFGHPDLRRILTDYGTKDHPMRKDFPLTGYTEVRYDVDKKRVVIDDLEVTQEFRMPDLTNTWRK